MRDKLGKGLKVWAEDDRLGNQLICSGTNGRIDLLLTNGRYFLVVELKVVRATASTFGQICSYMGWVKTAIAGGKPVRGCVVAPDADAAFDACLEMSPAVTLRTLDDLGLA